MAKRIAKTNAPMLPIEENNPVHYIAKKKTTIFNSIKVGASPEQEIGRQELEVRKSMRSFEFIIN